MKTQVTKRCPLCTGKAYLDSDSQYFECGSFGYCGERLYCGDCGLTLTADREDYGTEEVPYYDIQYNKEVVKKMRNDLLRKWNKRT